MNPQTYAQMLELQQQKGAPLTSQGQAPMQQQAPAGAPRYDSSNPLSEGSMAAVNAARQSMSGAGPKKRGFIDNMLRMVEMASIAKLRGSRELAAQNLGNMIRTPDEEEEAMRAQEAARASENFKMMQFLQANEHTRQKHSHSQDILSEQRRHHDMQSRHQGAHSDYYRAMAEKARSKSDSSGSYEGGEGLPEWGYSLKGITPSERRLIRSDMMERVHKPNEMKKAKQTLKEMQILSHKFPHLSKSFASALSTKDSGGVTNTAKRMFMNKDDNDAVTKFKKLSSDLVLHNTKSLGGTRANMFLEKMIKEASPDYGMTPDVVDYMSDHFDNVYFNPAMHDAKNVRSAIKGGFGALKPDVESLSEISEKSGNSDISKLSDEELMKLAQ